MAETMLVRLKARHPKKGCVLQRYTYRGIRFEAGRGWYRVDPEVARYLEHVHQIPDDEDSPLAFDVCTEAEARAVDKREARAARQVLPAEDAMDVTSRRPVRAGAARSRRVLPVHAERQRAPESQPPRRHAPAGRPEPIDEARPRFPPDDGDEHEREHAQEADEEPGAAEESDEQPDDEMEIDYEDAFGEGPLDDEAVDDELESTDELDPSAGDDDERAPESDDAAHAMTTDMLATPRGKRRRRGKKR